MQEKTNTVDPRIFLEFVGEICKKTYGQSHVMDLLLNETFDLIVLPVAMNECAVGYPWKFNVPILIVSPTAVPSWLTGIYGSPAPPSFIANLMTPYSQHMTFYQRTIPMFRDQSVNMAKSVEAGYAVSLEYTELSEQMIIDDVNQVIHEPKYKQRVGELSKLFRDQPDKPLDRAVFWTEYLLRHKGAPYLRSPARDLNYFQYHSLDVIGFLLGASITFLYMIFQILYFVCKKLTRIIFGEYTSIENRAKKLKKKN